MARVVDVPMVLVRRLLVHGWGHHLRAGVSARHVERAAHCHTFERLVSFHNFTDTMLVVLADEQADRGNCDAVDPIVAAFESAQELNWPRACNDKLVHRDAPEEDFSYGFRRDEMLVLQHQLCGQNVELTLALTHWGVH